MKALMNALLTLIVLAGGLSSHAACVVRSSSGQPASEQGDALFSLLKTAVDCPMSVQELKSVIGPAGLTNQAYMVANRGIHNPSAGSFSLFEEVTGSSLLLSEPVKTGEFFFGHFTAEESGIVVSDQEPSKGKLLIELIAWDHKKKLFNFYELIGAGSGAGTAPVAQWFYRGDSQDILNDNAQLYLGSSAQPKFGSTLRCSACHTSGGPIMKELAGPHNDWWTHQRPLAFSPNSPSPEIKNWLEEIGDASGLSRSVMAGVSQLEQSASYQLAKNKISLQAKLRPLFCETEINLESDLEPLDSVSRVVRLPSASVINPILAKGNLTLPVSDYSELLQTFGMGFPETNRADADHAWLTPVKGYSDLAAIESLVKDGTVSEEFVADVLAVDFENPLFSDKRCGLLKLVPPEGLASFAEKLKASSTPGASELFENLTKPSRTRSFHMKAAEAALAAVQSQLQNPAGQNHHFEKLITLRQAVGTAEISKNPRGQILEPGFRVIFPEPRF